MSTQPQTESAFVKVLTEDNASLRRKVEALEAEVAKLQGVLKQHDLCHDLHGKVNVNAFAKGCFAEQRRIYGCSPHGDFIDKLHDLTADGGCYVTRVHDNFVLNACIGSPIAIGDGTHLLKVSLPK